MSHITVYAYATTWLKGNMQSLNLGYCGASSPDEARGIAMRIGADKNPGSVMANHSVITVETDAFDNYDKAVGALEEIAHLLGLDPDSIELEDLMAAAKARLAPHEVAA